MKLENSSNEKKRKKKVYVTLDKKNEKKILDALKEDGQVYITRLGRLKVSETTKLVKHLNGERLMTTCRVGYWKLAQTFRELLKTEN